MSAEKAAHTPGPWVAQASEHGEYPHVYRPERIDKDGLKYWDERICVVYPSDADDDRVHHPGASANARLIASAPELLAALQELLDEQNDAPLERRRKQWTEACARARRAIAQAEGGA